jgi:hypothetical protein
MADRLPSAFTQNEIFSLPHYIDECENAQFENLSVGIHRFDDDCL